VMMMMIRLPGYESHPAHKRTKKHSNNHT